MKERETSDNGRNESQSRDGDNMDPIARLEKKIAFLKRKYEIEVERIEHESHLKDVKVEEMENVCMDLEERCNRLEELCEQQSLELVEARKAVFKLVEARCEQQHALEMAEGKQMPSVSSVTTPPPVRQVQRRCSMPSSLSGTALTSFFQPKTQVLSRTNSCHDINVQQNASWQPISTPTNPLRNQSSEGPLLHKQASWTGRLGTFGSSKEENKHERDLLRQLSVLQDEWTREVLELKLKLNQREAAIKTLEHALTLKEECVEELRTEMASMTTEMLTACSQRRPSIQSVGDCGSDSSTRVTESSSSKKSNSSKKSSKASASRRGSPAGISVSRRQSNN
jgi:hypothetical protein